MPIVTPAANVTASWTKSSHEPPSSVADVRAASTGSMPWTSTSQSRKSRIPVAIALSPAFSRVLALLIRPIGRPRKIVKPASAPRTSS